MRLIDIKKFAGDNRVQVLLKDGTAKEGYLSVVKFTDEMPGGSLRYSMVKVQGDRGRPAHYEPSRIEAIAWARQRKR